jgi:hypothetical protein
MKIQEGELKCLNPSLGVHGPLKGGVVHHLVFIAKIQLGGGGHAFCENCQGTPTLLIDDCNQLDQSRSKKKRVWIIDTYRGEGEGGGHLKYPL